MVDRRAEAVEGVDVLGNAVAHMALEAVAGMGEPEPRHQPVALVLGEAVIETDADAADELPLEA